LEEVFLSGSKLRLKLESVALSGIDVDHNVIIRKMLHSISN